MTEDELKRLENIVELMRDTGLEIAPRVIEKLIAEVRRLRAALARCAYEIEDDEGRYARSILEDEQ